MVSSPFRPAPDGTRVVNIGDTVTTVNLSAFTGRNLQTLAIENNGAATIYFKTGSQASDVSTIDTSTAYPIDPGEAIGIDVGYDRYFGFKCATGLSSNGVQVTIGSGNYAGHGAPGASGGGGGGDASAANQSTMIAALGAPGNAAVIDPGASASHTAALKGILSLLATLGGGKSNQDIVTAIGSITVPAPAGGATAARQDTIIAGLGAITDAAAAGDGSAIAILKQLRTLLGGSLTVGLPTGAATAANQAAGNTSLATIATNSATVAAGAATSAKQDGQQTSLTAIATAAGAPADAESTGTNDGSIIALIKRVRTYVNSMNTNIGTTADAEATGNGTLIAVTKRLRTLFGDLADTKVTNGDAASASVLALLRGIVYTLVNGVTTTPRKTRTWTRQGGVTSATPGTVTGMAAANSNRSGYYVENTHATAFLFIGFGEDPTNTVNSQYLKIWPGGTWRMSPDDIHTGTIRVCSDVASVNYFALETV